jgi:succinate dehydrogenase flavin-adding protein (antitoxin of CptAB toxin-antitoxin module)
MSGEEMDDFEAFLNEQDPDIWNWVSGKGEYQKSFSYFFFIFFIVPIPDDMQK